MSYTIMQQLRAPLVSVLRSNNTKFGPVCGLKGQYLLQNQSRNVIATSQTSHPDDEVYTSRLSGKQAGIVVRVMSFFILAQVY